MYAYHQVEDALDTLEKALTCLSPVKDGLGSGPLDHVHRDDQGVDMFLKNMAHLKAQERARESSSPGGGDQLAPIGEARCSRKAFPPLSLSPSLAV